MGEMDISTATASDYKNTITEFSVDSTTTDGPEDSKETKYTNEDWEKQLGYYKKIPELKNVIDAKATWTVGKGFKASPETELILSNIKGFGRDTFNTIIENLVRTYHISGDAFAEIITDDEGNLINLKPLDPSSMVIVANRQGIIIRYEQRTKVKQPNKKFSPEKIFHLSRNRVADEIHGESIIPALERIILMRNEAMEDWKVVLHRNVRPLRIWHLDTDDQTEINSFKAKVESAKENYEDMFIPKGAVVPEQVTTANNSSLNPLTWIENLNRYFYQAAGVPAIVVGSSISMTEASSKMEYLVFEQTISEEQLYIKEQILSQLNLEIELEFPASLQNELLSDKQNQDGVGVNQPQIQSENPIQPNDLTAEVQGRR